MGEGWELCFLAYGAPIWMRFLPTASLQRDTIILLSFGGIRELEGFDLLAG
jgi:hypothetical protein